MVAIERPSNNPNTAYTPQRSSPHKARSKSQIKIAESKMNRLSSLSMAELKRYRGVKARRAVVAKASREAEV